MLLGRRGGRLGVADGSSSAIIQERSDGDGPGCRPCISGIMYEIATCVAKFVRALLVILVFVAFVMLLVVVVKEFLAFSGVQELPYNQF